VMSGNHLDAVAGFTLTDALLYCLELLTAGLLAIGLGSPVAGLLQALLECRKIYAGGRFDPGHFDCALLSVCLAMLGPGAWSIDARLFGRRRVRIDRHPGS
jgi:putative oxidoreductase